MSSGRPPTLWWLLITAAVPSLPPLSITSGYSVPCTRNSASVSPPVFSSKTRTNSSPIALRFGLGLGDPGEPLEEAVAGVDVDQFDALVAAEGLDDLVALAAAHQPGVDVHAGQLMTDRLVDQRRGDRRVDAAAEPADRPGSPTWARTAVDLRIDDRAHRPRRRAPGEVVEEALQHHHAVRRVDDLRDGTARPRSCASALSNAATGASAVDAVATKPSGASVTASKWLIHTSWVDGRSWSNVGRPVGDLQLGPAVLAAHPPPDLAAELQGDQLGAVADAEDRDAEVVDRRVERRRAIDVHALRTTGQDQRRRWIGGQLGGGDRGAARSRCTR